MYSQGMLVISIFTVCGASFHILLFLFKFFSRKDRIRLLQEQSYFIMADILIITPTLLSMPFLRIHVSSQLLGEMFYTPLLFVIVNSCAFTIMKYYTKERSKQ